MSTYDNLIANYQHYYLKLQHSFLQGLEFNDGILKG